MWLYFNNNISIFRNIHKLRFKLPRNKFGFVGIRNIVSDFVSESLPNIKGIYADLIIGGGNGVFGKSSTTASKGITTNSNTGIRPDFDASRYSSTYQDNAPVQQKAIQVYLEFYIN